VGNFLIASAGYSLREALSMAQKNGVDPKAVVDMLTHTLLSAPIYQSYGKRIAENNEPFSQNAILLKDVGFFKQTAQQVEPPTPIASLLHDLLRSEGRGTLREHAHFWSGSLNQSRSRHRTS
jgi:3-hydroxyisobutyrate dehydrogenase-like beta-hydroxyacid dehydrogenase